MISLHAPAVEGQAARARRTAVAPPFEVLILVGRLGITQSNVADDYAAYQAGAQLAFEPIRGPSTSIRARGMLLWHTIKQTAPLAGSAPVEEKVVSHQFDLLVYQRILGTGRTGLDLSFGPLVHGMSVASENFGFQQIATLSTGVRLRLAHERSPSYLLFESRIAALDESSPFPWSIRSDGMLLSASAMLAVRTESGHERRVGLSLQRFNYENFANIRTNATYLLFMFGFAF